MKIRRNPFGNLANSAGLRGALALAAVAAVSASARAQQGPPPFDGPPQGFGGPGFGGPPEFGRPAQAGLPSNETLIQRQDVQEDLELTKSERAQFDALQASLRTQMDAARESADFDPRQFDRLRRASAQSELKLLTADQIERLHGIAIQLAGSRAILDPQIQKELGLSADQIAHAKSLVWLQGAANRSVYQKLQNGEIDSNSAQNSVQYNSRALESLLFLVLTSKQKSDLQSLAGRRFSGAPPFGSQSFSFPGGLGGPGGPGGPGGRGGPGGPPGWPGAGGQLGGGYGFGEGPDGGPPDGGPGGGPPDGGPGGPPPGGGPGNGPPPGGGGD